MRWAPYAALLVLAACSGDGETVTISGDVEGLDTLALRGDSLLARADRLPEGIFDTTFTAKPLTGVVTATATGNGTLEPTVAAPRPVSAPTTGAEITRRAQIRGDSIARAYAAQLTGANSDGSRSRADTIRGVVSMTGSADAPQVVVRSGTTTYSVSGMATRGMLRLAGNEVVVRGVKISPRDIVVADYIVRTARGLPALDGTIGNDGALRLTDGSGTRHVALPAEVRALVGTRVWVAMRGSNAAAFGIVTTR